MGEQRKHIPTSCEELSSPSAANTSAFRKSQKSVGLVATHVWAGEEIWWRRTRRTVRAPSVEKVVARARTAENGDVRVRAESKRTKRPDERFAERL